MALDARRERHAEPRSVNLLRGPLGRPLALLLGELIEELRVGPQYRWFRKQMHAGQLHQPRNRGTADHSDIRPLAVVRVAEPLDTTAAHIHDDLTSWVPHRLHNETAIPVPRRVRSYSQQ